MFSLTQQIAGLTQLLPECLLLLGIITTLLVGMLYSKTEKIIGLLTYGLVIVVLICDFSFQATPILGMLKVNAFTQVLKIFFCISGMLTILLQKGNYKSSYYILLHGLILSAFFLVMSTHFIMFIITFETVSFTGYMLVGYHTTRNSAEASVKYFLLGASATAIMIFGMSLFLPFMESQKNIPSPLFIFSVILFLSGLLFKISAAPLHFWTPDIYSAAPLPVVALLSVVPKIAGLAAMINFHPLLARLCSPAIFNDIIAVIAIATILAGVLGALMQKEIMRMMGWSSIAQSGFMLIAVITFPAGGTAAFLFYGTILLLANYAVFYSIQSFASITFSGLSQVKIIPALCSFTGLLALTGLPPTGGIFAKVILFSSLWNYGINGHPLFLALLVLGLLSAAASAFFYFRIPYHIFMKKKLQQTAEIHWVDRINLLLALLLLALFFYPQILTQIFDRISL